MGEIVATYGEFKNTLDTELKKSVDSFVKIGYLLKIARDTEILRESGYATVAEFAKAEYGFTKDIVSRYIAINDKYSENGYSEELKAEYRAYGVAKLAEMLTLSDEVIQSLSPDLTRKEIQEIKKEIKEEEKISDLEVIMEAMEQPERPEFATMAEEALYQYFKEQRQEFVAVYKVLNQELSYETVTEKLLDIIAPSGITTKMPRVPGKGKIMISIKGKEEKVDFLNVRTNEKESHEWQMTIVYLNGMFSLVETDEPQSAWELLYGEPFETPEEKTEVAPVQHAENNNIVETNTENKEIVDNTAEDKGLVEEIYEEPEIEKVTGEVVEESGDLEEIKEKLASAFIKRYETRLEESENMRDEIFAILDRVHKSEWIFEYNEEEFFAVEVAGFIKIRQGTEIIAELMAAEFYQIMYKVYWENPQSCTGATEEQLPGQKVIEDYPEVLPENTKSNPEVWREIKAQAKEIIEQLQLETEKDNYSIVKWHAKKLTELMEEIR